MTDASEVTEMRWCAHHMKHGCDIVNDLEAYAAGQDCDGEPYDTMVAAAAEIRELRSQRKEVGREHDTAPIHDHYFSGAGWVGIGCERCGRSRQVHVRQVPADIDFLRSKVAELEEESHWCSECLQAFDKSRP